MKPLNEIKDFETYYFLNDFNTLEYSWLDKEDREDLDRYNCGNFYLDRQEAEAKANANQVIVDLSRCEGARKFVYDADNHCLDMAMGRIEYEIWLEFPYGAFHVYFSTSKKLKLAIAKVGEERILKALRYLELGEY